MTKRKPLEWFRNEDGKLGYPACVNCFKEFSDPIITESVASISIESNKSFAYLMKVYIDSYHAHRHDRSLM